MFSDDDEELSDVKTSKKKRKLEDFQVEVENCKSKWLKVVTNNSLKYINQTNIDVETLCDEPARHVLIYDDCNSFVFQPREVMAYNVASAWRHHGVLHGLFWNDEKFTQLKAQFVEMVSQVGDAIRKVGYGYDKNDEICLPRRLDITHCNENISPMNDYYMKIISILIEKNCSIDIKPLSLLIAEYAFDEYDDINSWRFAIHPSVVLSLGGNPQYSFNTKHKYE